MVGLDDVVDGAEPSEVITDKVVGRGLKVVVVVVSLNIKIHVRFCRVVNVFCVLSLECNRRHSPDCSRPFPRPKPGD